MKCTQIACAGALLACLICSVQGAAATQAGPEQVPLIMSQSHSMAGFVRHRLSKLYGSIRRRAGNTVKRMVLPLTKAEVWSVPKDKVAAVSKAAARRGFVMSQLGAAWNHIFHRTEPDRKLNVRQKSILARARAASASVGVGIMAAPQPPMVEYALLKDMNTSDAAKITVALSDMTTLSITRVSVELKSGMCIWRGTVDGTGAPATLMWWPDGKMTGTVQHERRIYSIRHMGGEMHAIVAMGEERMPQEHAPMPARMRANDPNLRDDPLINQGEASGLRPATTGINAPAPQAPVNQAKEPQGSGFSKGDAARIGSQLNDIVIDVIVAYTKKAAANYVDIKRELTELSIEEANESFRMSNLGHIKLRLVHAYQTDYVEDGEHFNHLWRFADRGDGYMEEIHWLRDKYKADVAVLVVDDPNGCGLATRVSADADDAFAVVHHECAATTYSVAHEIGHLIGARHDLKFDKVMTPFPYGHGFVNGTKWRDIMSYKQSCGNCPRLPIWSSPMVMINGEPAGTAELDNARVIAGQAARVAAFR